MTTSAKSLSFLRPIFAALRRSRTLVLLCVTYSRMGGTREYFVVHTASDLKHILRGLPAQALVCWQAIAEPDWRESPRGIVPLGDGAVMPGAY